MNDLKICKNSSCAILKQDDSMERGEFFLRCAEMADVPIWKELLVREAANVVAGYEILPPLMVYQKHKAKPRNFKGV